ncbi:MAG: hypothetical protein R2733_17150 [Acidimicrobiales bacterium]
MELISEPRLRSALHLVVSLSEHGIPDAWPTGLEIEAYVDDCERGSFQSIFGVTGMIGTMRLGIGPSRPLAQRLIELGWALEIDHRGSIAATDLGLSVHQAMLAEQRAAAAHEVNEIRLGVGEDVAWEELVRSLSRFEPYMLVDPYLEWRHLQLLIQETRITQALTAFKSGGQANERRQSLHEVVARREQYGAGAVSFEVRAVADPKTLHDRFIVTEDEVWTLGASLNGIGKNPTLLVKLGNNADSTRRDNRKLWDSATPLDIDNQAEADE